MSKSAYVQNNESSTHKIVLLDDSSDTSLAPTNLFPLKSHDIIRKTGIPGTYYDVVGREENGIFILKELSQNLIWPVPEKEIESYEKVSI